MGTNDEYHLKGSPVMTDTIQTKILFPKGKIIFTEGALAEKAYIILSGHVELTKETKTGESRTVNTLGENAIFGELALFDENKRLVTATAVDDVECMEISEQAFQNQLKNTPTFIKGLLRLMVRSYKKELATR